MPDIFSDDLPDARRRLAIRIAAVVGIKGSERAWFSLRETAMRTVVGRVAVEVA
jgi:hypothetical protein